MKKLLCVVLLAVSGFGATPSPLKQSLVQLRKDLTAWGKTFVPRQGELRTDGRSLWYSMPMTMERKAIDREYGQKFDARITAAVKSLTSAGLKTEAGTVDWFHNESVAPPVTFKHYLDELQSIIGDLE